MADLPTPVEPDPDPASQIIAAIDEAALADAMFDAARAEVPTYGAIQDPSMAAGVHAHCVDHARATVEALRRRAPPPPNALGFVADRAAERAQQGVGLASLLHAYRVGYRVCFEAMKREATRLECDREVALELSAVLMQYFSAICSLCSQVYLDHAGRPADGDDGASQSIIIPALLAGRVDEVAAALTPFRLEPASSAVVVLAEVDPRDSPPAEAVSALVAGLARRGITPVVAAVERQIVAIVSADGSSIAAVAEQAEQTMRVAGRALGCELRGGMSTLCRGLHEVPRAHRDAGRALKRTSADRPFVKLADVRLFDDLLAQADSTTHRMIPPWARSLRDEDDRRDGELIGTLDAYLDAELSVGRTAKRLGVHPNTVRYRLQRVESITAHSTKDFHDLVEITAALRLAQLVDEPDADA